MAVLKKILTLFRVDEIVKEQSRKNKDIIIGGQAIAAQLGFYSRSTTDYDILTSKPSKGAKKLERKLDEESGENIYYVRSSKFHPTTKKVIYVGQDNKKNTKDDETIADYSPFRPITTTTIDGIRYASLTAITKEKQEILRQKKFSFRHEEDREDINLINRFQRFQK